MLQLQQQLKLQQKLSPQQIQYIKLLQLNSLALEQRVQAELQANPMLEEVAEVPDPAGDEAAGEQAEDEFDWEELLPAGDEDFYGYKARVDRSDRIERPLPATMSLVEHLQSQRAFLGLSPLETLIAEQIIGSIDADGYLRRSVRSIVDDVMFTQGERLEEEDVERVLQKIQRLDPPGIGARNLQECLLLQLEMAPRGLRGRKIASQLLSEHFEDFTMKRFTRIRQKLGVDDRTLKAAVDTIQGLNPKPGEGTIRAQENYITPDFEVRTTGDAMEISLVNRQGPRVQISREYRDMLAHLTPKRGPVKRSGAEAETRKFLKRRLDAARWFIDAVNQRRQTLLAVMKAIVAAQQDFFIYGPAHLKPLILLDIAEAIDMDISTVSRVVNGKYVQCASGVFELKYFFSEGVATQSGTPVSSRVVKSVLEDIVRNEDKSVPLSDRKLAELLAARQFKIARRTVSKYREQLGIPVARMRREIVLPP